jgi:hypothetical protein
MNMLMLDLQILLASKCHDEQILNLIYRMLTELSLLSDKVDYLIGDSEDDNIE